MLAALKFIELAAKFTGRKDKVVIEGVSDNEELIRRCKAHSKYNDPFPQTTTKGEFDLTEQVFITSQAGILRTTFR